ncbi:hypothetical protein KFE96_01710 [Kordiimonas sp. SCSIO 12603]|uniref:hypothetical protein n=1 Tax=Kordiimonas sp. SCSIO 12603 TaxID=2829596 RepID=UPI002105E825|nr:hypothetical protein [Kordiimonas sp. SCSIO 12603]UTW59049.1 hypothetical protein KFE96_01710 [Kordiimonas sp. SCSIO 12603]
MKKELAKEFFKVLIRHPKVSAIIFFLGGGILLLLFGGVAKIEFTSQLFGVKIEASQPETQAETQKNNQTSD